MNNFENDVLRLNQLKLKPYSGLTKSDIRFLGLQWVFNWVWPEQYGWLLRQVMTWLFWFLDRERHDFNFFVWWTEKDFKNANWGILKYSFISLASEYKQIWELGLKKLYLCPRFFILLPFKVLVILFSYNACVKWWRKAFNFH